MKNAGSRLARRIASGILGGLFAIVAAAQSPTADQLNALKNLPQDQQSSIMQSVLGKSDGTGKKTDTKLETPETVLPKSDQEAERLRKQLEQPLKTSDGHILRQPDENPELRADDTVLVELVPIDEIRRSSSAANPNNNGATGGSPSGSGNGVIIGPAVRDNTAGANGVVLNTGNGIGTDYGSGRFKDDPASVEHREKARRFKDRVEKSNPYKLNRYGALEIPGLPAIPLAGLTADEASKRLSGDPDLKDFVASVTLLRLQQSGEEALKPFGYDLFEGVPSTFAPVSDIQVPMEYIVGPGDTLTIQLYGNEPATYSLTVERDGRINFPKLGPIMVSGMTYDAARATIEHRVNQQLIGTRVSVTMGDLRSIRVFVLGEAEKPGSYTVSGLSTMTNALLVSGGVKKIGSLRNIQLKRNGKLVTVLDLYDLLLHGDTSGDRQLMPGDVIFIPPIGSTVSVDGSVRRPAIYELKTEKSVADVVEVAGGVAPDADEKLIQVERIQPSRLREMIDVDLLSKEGAATLVANGDKLRVPAIRPTLENSVQLSGFVFRPGSFEYHQGMRLSDVLGSFDELRPNADRHYIMIRRQVPPRERLEVVSADLDAALAQRGGPDDPELQPRDQINVFDLSASREYIVAPVIKDIELQATPDSPAQVVSVDGRVKAPGRYVLEPGMRISDLIRAGGSLEDAAYRGEAELTRYEVIDGKSRLTELIPVDLDAIRRGDSAANLRLKAYDLLLVKSVPLWDEPGSIVLEGEVRFPGKYPIHRGETLHSVLIRAGGFTDIAFGEGAVFTREELKEKEKAQLELLTNRFQSDLTSLSLQSLASSTTSTNPNASAGAAQGLSIGQQLLEQLRNTKPVGRLVIDVNQVLKSRPGSLGDVVLRDGDRLSVPKKTQEITILGEVQSPTSQVFQPGLTRDDYIAKSGGATQKADRKRIYVVRANGDVVSGERSGWFRKTRSIEMRPGDTIVVPLDAERVRALPLWTAVTTIMYNIAIAVLALRNL